MSIYLQLTEKCNMRCPHCCFAATTKGTFMSREVFQKAIDLAKDHQWSITLGGGEPTLHPDIIEWAMEAARASIDASMEMDGPATMIITNGKKTDVAIKLAQMAHLGMIAAEVSRDPWHDEIDPRVVAEFTRYNKPNPHLLGGHERGKGYAGVRNVSRSSLVAAGRAKTNGNIETRKGCCCDALFIKPNGDVYQCGCQKTKIGNILTDAIPERNLNQAGTCEEDLEDLED